MEVSGSIRTLAAAAALACVCSAVALAPPSSALAPPSSALAPPAAALVPIAGEVPPGLATAGALAPAGAGLPAAVTVTVTLRRTHPAAFARLLVTLGNPASPMYGRFLTQRQVAARYGPSASEYGAVRAWLLAHGLTVAQGSANRLTLSARGSPAALARAFHVTLASYRRGAQTVWSNVGDPLLPARIARDVLAVTGLANLARPRAAPSDATSCEALGGMDYSTPQGSSAPCANLCQAGLTAGFDGLSLQGNGQLTAVSPFVDDLQPLAGAPLGVGGDCAGVWAYESMPELDGLLSAAKGSARAPLARIALLEFDSYVPTDVTAWLTLVGLPASLANAVQLVNVNGGVPTPGAGESEVLLDIDTILGATRGSPTIAVYDAPPSTSFVQIFQAMIAGGASVIANPWSQCEDETPEGDALAIDSVLASAAASGITVLNATGDDGSTCADGATAIGVPADSPHATAVGGTTPRFGPGLTRGGQTWWDDARSVPAGGSGGYGTSRYFARPAFQGGLSAAAGRSVPDVAFDADPAAGVAICQADAGGCPDGLMRGGTSLAVASLAALVADANQYLGRRVGDLNSALYPLAHSSALQSPASMGSDFAHVGLGSVQLASLVEALGHRAPGAVSATRSLAIGIGEPQAGSGEPGLVRVDLADAAGLPLAGRTVALTVDGGSSAVVSPATATTDGDGAAVFSVTDSAPETVTMAVADTSDHLTLAATAQLTFTAAVATGSDIVASPTIVANDGSAHTTVSVNVEGPAGQPAAGRTVALSAGQSQASVSPAQAQTDANGQASFQVTDTTAESVALTATDVSDGGLALPGSAGVTFQPAGAGVCADAAPTASSPFTVSILASGLPVNELPLMTDVGGLTFTDPPCGGITPPALDPSGNLYVADSFNGEIYAFPPTGGSGGPGNALAATSFLPGGQLGQIAFGPQGQMYAGLLNTAGNYNDPEVVQLDPDTGAIERVLATAASGLAPCPGWIAVDPLSGDIFTTDNCGGALASPHITRISHPDSASPAVSDYADVGAAAGLSFAPDGTLYVAYLGASASGSTPATPPAIVSVSATNQPGPPTVTTVATSSAGQYFGVGVGATNAAGQATALYGIQAGGELDQITLGPAVAVAAVATRSSGGFSTGATVVPGGCIYMDDSDDLLAISPSGASCAAASTAPQLSLTAASASQAAHTGTTLTFTATLANDAGATGVPIRFVVDGPNGQVAVVGAGSGGHAAFTYTPADAGADTVWALTVVAGRTIRSAPIVVRVTAARHATLVSLGATPAQAAPGARHAFSASLVDLSATPPAPVSGAIVTLAVQGKGCVATTNQAGVGTCAITLPAKAGLQSVTATYAGGSDLDPASASSLLELGSVGLPAPSHASLSPALACTASQVALIDVVARGGHVTVAGAARVDLAGAPVQIRIAGQTKPVAGTTVRADGTFSAMAPLPGRTAGQRAAVHYVAVIGTLHSVSVGLAQRLVLARATRSAGRVGVAGRLTATPGTARTVTVMLRTACGRWKTVATAALAPRGGFAATFAAPGGTRTGVFRVQTTLSVEGHPQTVYSLALPATAAR